MCQVVITNELTTRHMDEEWTITPALGDAHSHKINQRLMLRKEIDTGRRVITIDKSLICGKVSVPFQVYAATCIYMFIIPIF